MRCKKNREKKFLFVESTERNLGRVRFSKFASCSFLFVQPESPELLSTFQPEAGFTPDALRLFASGVTSRF